MDKKTTIKVFISAGNDLKEEREKAFSVIDKLNETHPHLHVEPSGWDSYVTGPDEISSILKQSDFVIFIFYSRIGKYTREEFERALDEDKKLFVFFKEGFSPIEKEDYIAYEELLHLKEGLDPALKIYYRDPSEFERLLYEKLDRSLADNYRDDPDPAAQKTSAANKSSTTSTTKTTTTPPLTPVAKKFFLPSYLTESNHQQTPDQLDFENDIESISAVMSMATVKPPLAVGLFGKWGSGKSFFMEKLYEKVEDYALSENTAFVKNVVQVRFNSWHYADANLWASLFSEIFDTLNRYAKKENKEHELARLQSTLEINFREQQAVEKRTIELEKDVSSLEAQQKDKRETLADLTGIGLLKLVFSDQKVSEDLQTLKTGDVEKIIEDKNEIDKGLKELSSTWNQAVASWKMLKRSRGARWLFTFLIAAIVILASVLISGILSSDYQKLVSKIALYSSGAATVVTYIVKFLRPVIKKVNEGSARLISIKNTLEGRPEKVDPELEKDKAALSDLRKEITLLNTTISDTQQKIDDIRSGKRLFDFIEKITLDENYSKQLGVISWIRRDFNRLDELLRMQHDKDDPKTKNIENPLEVKLRIDRIILYIDDLDRCNADIVIKVLEAIHLLLAFPLFVVVVGVDPRWLNNALNEKYKLLFGIDKEDSVTNGADRKKEETDDNIATSYDYLEKIFQVPFGLKPITKTGREKLISYLVKDEMAKDEKGQAAVTAAGATNQQTAAAGTTTPATQANTGDGHTPGEEKPTMTEAQKKEAKEKRIALLTEKLSFTRDELDFMKRVSVVYASSPRTINRFVNIYRIIKSHQSLDITGDYSADDYGPILILLSIVVGFSAIAQPFIGSLQKASSKLSLKEFLEGKQVDKKIKEKIMPCLTDDHLGIKIERFQKNVELISRFSFRTLIE